MKRAVFLDRDGVINRTFFRQGKPRSPVHIEEFEFLPGVHDAVALLRRSGFVLVVVTNQPDIHRGWLTRDQIDAINQHVQRELGVDEVLTCFHDDSHRCECRKPKPGMLLAATQRHDIELSNSFMIGDRRGDIEAGRVAGCRTFLVESPATDLLANDSAQPDFRVGSLLEAARTIARISAE